METVDNSNELTRQIAAMRTELHELRRMIRLLLNDTATPAPTRPTRPTTHPHSTPDDFQHLPDGTVRPLRATRPQDHP